MKEFNEEMAAIEATEQLHPMEEAVQANIAMSEKICELEMTVEKLSIEKEELSEKLETATQELRNSQAALAQSRTNASDMAKLAKREQEGRANDRRAFEIQVDAIRQYVAKPVLLPIILGVSSGILALLVGVCIDHGLMTCVLGDPLGAGLLAACTLFAGVVYERLRLR